MLFDLRLSSGNVVQWEGANEQEAARRFVAAHPAAVVVATRPAPRHGLFFGLAPIKEMNRND